jgi:predicted  nucleic acid-binding Zn-ribbon protein
VIVARLRFVFLAVGLATSLFNVSACLADPSTDLAEAEGQRTVAKAEVSSAQAKVTQAEKALSPVARKAEAADKKVQQAEAELDQLKDEVVSVRVAAAKQIAEAEQNYDDEKSSHDSTAGIGVLIVLLAIVAASGAFAYSRFRKWPLSKALTQLLAAALGLIFIGGVVLAAAAAAPDAPRFSRETLELASDAKGDPVDPPTPELRSAQAAVSRLTRNAEPLDTGRDNAEELVTRAEGDVQGAESRLTGAESDVRSAEEEVAHLQAIAEEESRFREEATTVDYKQLIKNPNAYKGEMVVYTGQVFQIQEEGGFGVMLLSVTDEGYGFWTDNIWVEFDEPTEAAEEDIVTVYGKITGSEEYETQIGGSTYVPRMKAKYFDG